MLSMKKLDNHREIINMIKQSGNKLGIVVMAVLGVFLLSPALANSQESCPAATQQEVKTQGEISAQGDNEAKRAPVFCPAKSTGQLCGHGTAARLKLDGQNRERWNAVVRRYNEQVENAQKQLIEEARPFLTPEQA